MNSELSVMNQLCTEEKLFAARLRLKNKIKKVLSANGHEIIKLAEQAVMKPDTLTDGERIFHESAIAYETGKADVKIKTFDEWRKGESNG